jgi:hypothetical protein
MTVEQTRLAEAKVVVQNLLDSLETRSEPISWCLLKAKRLARLIRDSDAQTWLDFEMKGYPDPFQVSQIGNCEKYMRLSRFNADGSFKMASLPEMEANIAGIQKHMDAVRLPSSISTSEQRAGPFGLNVATTLVGNVNTAQNALRESLADDVQVFEAMKAGLHAFATDCQISLAFGELSSDIFERARVAVDLFVRTTSPKAAEQLLASYDRLAAGDPEALAQCLTSCRRVLLSVADAVFPARNERYVDSSGTERKVGADDYKNRLLAFLDQRLKSKSSLSLLAVEIDHLAARLDSVYEKVCKGVHADVTSSEAELAVIHTYLFLAEIARLALPPSDG